MIKRTNTSQTTFGFDFTFCNHLSRNNRWVRLADQIPCLSAEVAAQAGQELGAIYEESLSKDKGAPTIPSRVVIGALIIKHLKNLSDEEVIEDIRENPYCQYFLGYSSFRDRQVFAPSLSRHGENRGAFTHEKYQLLSCRRDGAYDHGLCPWGSIRRDQKTIGC